MTPHEIQAVTGHTTLKEVDRYTRDANQRRLAASGFGQLDAKLTEIVEQITDKTVPLSSNIVPPKRKALK